MHPSVASWTLDSLYHETRTPGLTTREVKGRSGGLTAGFISNRSLRVPKLIFDFLLSGLAAGIYTTNSPDACQYVAENCEANIMVVENHKQLVKILQVRLCPAPLRSLANQKPAAF